MTAGAVTSLLMLTDILHTRGSGPSVNPYKKGTLPGQTVECAAKGLDWFGRNFKLNLDGYLLYSTERIGLAGGFKRFGTGEWFRDGVDVLLKGQSADGSWTPPVNVANIADRNVNTALALLFLSHGDAPILINKLKWGDGGADFTWNNYPRDCANLIRWYNRTYEANAGWQIVDFGTTEDFYDAPILYMCGSTAPQLTESQADDLRRYIDRGGVLLCVPAGDSKAFADGVIDMGHRLYPSDTHPECRAGPLTPDHPLMADIARSDPKLAKMKITHMHNGTRSFLFLLPDVAWAWNSGKAISREESFEFINHLRKYATDNSMNLPPKLRVPIFPVDEPDNLPGIPVAVLKYESLGEVSFTNTAGKVEKIKTTGDWDSVPRTWETLNPWLQRKAGHRLGDIRGVTPGDPQVSKALFAHMAGRFAFTLADADKAALKSYINSGGYLLMEDVGAGKDRKFFTAATKLVAELFPKGELKSLPEDHPIFTGRFPKSPGPVGIENAQYSRRVQLDDKFKRKPELFALMIGDRPAVILSKLDISNGVQGAVFWDRYGYGTQTARELLGNIVMFIRAKRYKEM
jgi:hypothetical protein